MSDPFGGLLTILHLKKKNLPPTVVEEEVKRTYRIERHMAQSIGPVSTKEMFRAWRSSIRTAIRFNRFYGRKPPYLQ